MFSWFQASFHKGRNCEDQIPQIVQAIEDGCQQRLMQRSILTVLDFIKAYDTLWREKLLLHMLNTGIPLTFIRWIRSSLIDRRRRAQLFNVFSSIRCFTQGLPQGSVLAPVLFLFYIIDLASTLSNDAVIALFVDRWCLYPHYSSKKGRCWSYYPVSSKLYCDLEPGMEIKLKRWEKWGMPLLYLVKRQFLEPNYLYW